MRQPTCVFLLVALLLAMAAIPSTASMTEQDFKKMKMKDLRTFLDERGLGCPGCQEKSDFVRVAFANRDKKPSGQEEKRPVPNGKLWEVWSAIAKTECEEATKMRGNDPAAAPFSEVCHTISLATDSFMMQHGKNIANRLKKAPQHMLKTSFKDVYYDAGVRLLKNLANHCLASPSQQSKCESLSYVMNTMETSTFIDFKAWMTNVGIENTNPMYDIIDARDDL